MKIKIFFLLLIAILITGCVSVATPPSVVLDAVNATIGDGVYLYNNDTIMHLNESLLNETIDDRVNITVYENATPGGVDTSVQFNDGNVFDGESDFTYDETTNLLSVNGELNVDSINIVGDDISEIPSIKLQSYTTNQVEGAQIQFLEHASTWGTNAYGFKWVLDGNTNQLKLQSAALTTVVDNIMNINRGGTSIGMGKSADTNYRLDVEGKLRINNELSSQTSLYLKGTGSNYYQPSAGSNYFNKPGVGNTLYIYDGSDYTTLDANRLTIRDAGVSTVYIRNSGNSYFNGGNVGIGTTTPDVKLEVVGSGSSTDVLRLVKGTGTGGILFTFDEAGRYPSYIRTFETPGGNGYMSFGVNSDSGTTNEVMKLMGSGRVNIDGPLSIHNLDETMLATISNHGGDLGDESLLRIGGVSTHYGVYIGSSNEAGTPSAWRSAFVVKTNDYTGTDHVERFRVTSDGDVGIGTTTPDEKLEVDGNVKATSFIGDGSGLTNIDVTDSISNVLKETSATNLIPDSRFYLDSESDKIWQINNNHHVYSSAIWMHDNQNSTVQTYNESMWSSSNRKVEITSTDINFTPAGYDLEGKFVKFTSGDLTNYSYLIDSYNASTNTLTIKVQHNCCVYEPHYTPYIPVNDTFDIVTIAGRSGNCLGILEGSLTKNSVSSTPFIPFDPTKPVAFSFETYARNMHINQTASRHYTQYEVYDADYNPVKRWDGGGSVTDNTNGWSIVTYELPIMSDIDTWSAPVNIASPTPKMYFRIVIKPYDEGDGGTSSSAWFVTGFSANAGTTALSNTPHSLTEEGEQNIFGDVNIYDETDSQSNLFVEGNIEIGDLNTGTNAGSSLCIDTNNNICACGSCA